MTYRNPYQALGGGQWRRANFHTHAGTGYKTCGENPAGLVAGLYREMGYEFLCLSNHDHFTDASALSDDKMLLVPGAEYSKNEHMLTVGVDRSLHALAHQEAIDETNAMGGFAVLCHPNWNHPEYWSKQRLMQLRGWLGMEVLNWVIYRMNGSGRATDLWDYVLSQGRMVYGFGSDDFHLLTDAGRSFNLIYTASRTYEDMRGALALGQFCVSTGLRPEYLTLDGDIIRVKAAYLNQNYADTFLYRFVGPRGRVLSEQSGSEASAALGGEAYARVEVYGENGALLFFQPVWREGVFTADRV